MALTYAFRQSIKQSRRRSRRGAVVAFGLVVLLGLAECGHPLGFHNLGERMMPYLMAIGAVYRSWRWNRLVKVSSLDDRAMLEHGVTFDMLGISEQKDLLRRYRVGTFVMGYYPDEREETVEREWSLTAYKVLAWLLPIIAVVYWAGWRVLPEGAVRAAWTDGPGILSWMFLLVLALPQVLRMWTEPDEVVGDPRAVAETQT